MAEIGQPINFSDVIEGDTLTFLTRDNGFGGSGGDIERTGVVTLKTEKVVDVHVGNGLPVFRNGKSRVEGAGARLRRIAWPDRCVRLVARPE